MKLHTSLYQDIVSTTLVSLLGQGQTLTYCSRSVEHNQIYVYPLRLAPFLRE